MKVGDLIAFRLRFMTEHDWSNPAIVLSQFDSVDALESSNLWVVWCDGLECIVDEKNYEVIYLTSTLRQRA